jgi:hypothetical protein
MHRMTWFSFLSLFLYHISLIHPSSIATLYVETPGPVEVTLRLTVSHFVLVSSPIRGSWPDFNLAQLRFCLCLASFLMRRRICPLSVVTANFTVQFVRPCVKSMSQILKMCMRDLYKIQFIQDLCQSRLWTADYALSSSHYNGTLVTWTVVSLTAAKFNPITFSVSGFALSNIANICIFMILYGFCLVPV